MTNQEPVSTQDLMRYLDGELPPTEQRRVELALEASPELREQLRAFRSLRAGLHDLTFPDRDDRSVWDRVAVRIVRSRARWFVVAGAALWLVYAFVVLSQGSVDAWTRVTVAGIAIGVLVLFALVIRDRYRSWADDR
jgi:anti-sigma factor RsiW